MSRRATVLGTDASGHLVVSTAEGALGTAPVPRPYVGSSQTGFHSAPPTGAQVLVLHEAQYKPAAVVSAGDALSPLPALAAGESAIFGPDGSVLSYATAGSGPKYLYRDAAGTLIVSATPNSQRVDVAATGGLFLNGVPVAVVGGGGGGAGSGAVLGGGGSVPGTLGADTPIASGSWTDLCTAALDVGTFMLWAAVDALKAPFGAATVVARLWDGATSHGAAEATNIGSGINHCLCLTSDPIVSLGATTVVLQAQATSSGVTAKAATSAAGGVAQATYLRALQIS